MNHCPGESLPARKATAERLTASLAFAQEELIRIKTQIRKNAKQQPRPDNQRAIIGWRSAKQKFKLYFRALVQSWNKGYVSKFHLMLIWEGKPWFGSRLAATAPHLQGKSIQRQTHTHTSSSFLNHCVITKKIPTAVISLFKKMLKEGETLTSAPQKRRTDVLPAAAGLSFSSKKNQESANKPVSASQRAFCLPSGSRNQSLKQLHVQISSRLAEIL